MTEFESVGGEILNVARWERIFSHQMRMKFRRRLWHTLGTFLNEVKQRGAIDTR